MGHQKDLSLKSSPVFTFDEGISGANCTVSLTFECARGYTVRYVDLVVYRNKKRIFNLEQVLLDNNNIETFKLGNFFPEDNLIIKFWIRTMHIDSFRIKATIKQTNPDNEQNEGPEEISSSKDWDSEFKYTVIANKTNETTNA